jgi:hypothetical protein
MAAALPVTEFSSDDTLLPSSIPAFASEAAYTGSNVVVDSSCSAPLTNISPSSSFHSSSQLASFARLESNVRRPQTAASVASIASSQPVLVRAYDQLNKDKDNGSTNHSHSTSFQDSSAGMLSSFRRLAGPSGSERPLPNSNLPPINQFTFSQVLQAIQPDIDDAVGAIAEICARSKMSSADSYGAHLPPQGTITETARRQGVYPSMTLRDLRVIGDALDSVPEASSSSERLAAQGETRLDGSTVAGSARKYKNSKRDDDGDTNTLNSTSTRISIQLKVKDGKAVSSVWTTRPGSPTVNVTIVDASSQRFLPLKPSQQNISDRVLETGDQQHSFGIGSVSWRPWRTESFRLEKSTSPPVDAKSALGALHATQ